MKQKGIDVGAKYNLSDHIENLNLMSALPENAVDEMQQPDGPLVLGIDEDGEPVERDGGIVGNLLILGSSRLKPYLEEAILRGIQIIRPDWETPHSVLNESGKNYKQFLENNSAYGKNEILESIAIGGVSVKATTDAMRFFGPVALQRQVERASFTMDLNKKYMIREATKELPPHKVQTLHIARLDQLDRAKDKHGIYSTLLKMIEGDCSAYGVNLILSADDLSLIPNAIKENVLICSLKQDTRQMSISLFGQQGLEVARPYVGIIETQSDTIQAFRF